MNTNSISRVREGVICKFFFPLVFFIICFSGCKDDDDDPKDGNQPTIYQYVQSTFYYYYYWGEKVDQYTTLTVPQSGDPKSYFNSLVYDVNKASAADKNSYAYDRDWSFMLSYDEYYAFFQQGKNTSFGFFPVLALEDGNRYTIRVGLVYADSPMDRIKVERGYKMLRINGKSVLDKTYSSWDELYKAVTEIEAELAKNSCTFLFEKRDGKLLSEQEQLVVQSEFTMNPVICKNIYETEKGKIGYMVYNSFLTSSENDVINALTEFASQGVNELVLDLRYNGGGDVAVADHISECLLPASVGNNDIDFAKYVYSDRTKKETDVEDVVRKIKRNPSALNLTRLFVITTESSASASEEIINNLSPFLEVITVGDKTLGKPMAMSIIPYPPYTEQELKAGKRYEWILAPVTCRIDNVKGEGSFFSGIKPVKNVSDDLFHDFGVNVETLEGEACLETIVRYIQYGYWPTVSSKSLQETPKALKLNNMQVHAGCL